MWRHCSSAKCLRKRCNVSKHITFSLFECKMSPFARRPLSQIESIKSGDSCHHLIISTAHKLKFVFWDISSKYMKTSAVNLLLFSEEISKGTTPWTQHVNWIYIRRSRRFLNVSRTFNLRLVPNEYWFSCEIIISKFLKV